MDNDPKEEKKQLTAGEEDNRSMIERVKEGSQALKQRAIEEAE